MPMGTANSRKLSRNARLRTMSPNPARSVALSKTSSISAPPIRRGRIVCWPSASVISCVSANSDSLEKTRVDGGCNNRGLCCILEALIRSDDEIGVTRHQPVVRRHIRGPICISDCFACAIDSRNKRPRAAASGAYDGDDKREVVQPRTAVAAAERLREVEMIVNKGLATAVVAGPLHNDGACGRRCPRSFIECDRECVALPEGRVSVRIVGGDERSDVCRPHLGKDSSTLGGRCVQQLRTHVTDHLGIESLLHGPCRCNGGGESEPEGRRVSPRATEVIPDACGQSRCSCSLAIPGEREQGANVVTAANVLRLVRCHVKLQRKLIANAVYEVTFVGITRLKAGQPRCGFDSKVALQDRCIHCGGRRACSVRDVPTELLPQHGARLGGHCRLANCDAIRCTCVVDCHTERPVVFPHTSVRLSQLAREGEQRIDQRTGAAHASDSYQIGVRRERALPVAIENGELNIESDADRVSIGKARSRIITVTGHG
eukprot:7310163-Prymnesium_polylepis.3